MKQLQPKIGVTHLKIQALKRIKMRCTYAYEFWSTCSCSSFGFRASRNTLPVGQQIQCRIQGQALWGSTAVDLHGICAIDLAQWTSGYRSVFKFEARSTLSSGFSGTSSQVDLGRCQREKRLETLGGSCQKPDQQSQKSLSRRELGIGPRQYGLRSGFIDHRPHNVGFSMGQISLNKKRYQTSHAAGFEGTNPRLHLHFRSQSKRHKMVGRTDFRTWSHLHHGQGVYRLGKTFPDCELWGFFCHSGQGQSALYQIQIATRRQIHRIAERPNRQTVDSQIKRGFSYAFAKGSLLRRRKTEALGIPNKQLANSCLDCGEALQKAMGDRVIFQVDQRQLGNQALLRHKRQRGEDTNLDSGIAIFDSGHHSQKPKTVRKSSQYFADFECSPI